MRTTASATLTTWAGCSPRVCSPIASIRVRLDAAAFQYDSHRRAGPGRGDHARVPPGLDSSTEDGWMRTDLGSRAFGIRRRHAVVPVAVVVAGLLIVPAMGAG